MPEPSETPTFLDEATPFDEGWWERIVRSQEVRRQERDQRQRDQQRLAGTWRDMYLTIPQPPPIQPPLEFLNVPITFTTTTSAWYDDPNPPLQVEETAEDE